MTILVLLVDSVWYNFCIIGTPLTNLTLVLHLVYNGSFTQEQLKEMSSTRLTVKLGKAGFDRDRLEQSERADLLEAMAEIILAEPTAELESDVYREVREASQIPLPAGDSSSAASDGGSAAVRQS